MEASPGVVGVCRIRQLARGGTVTSFAALLVISGLSVPLFAHAADLPALNPDVSQATIESTICVHGYSKSVRPGHAYARGIKIKLMAERGYGIAELLTHRLDHIVPLCLGGHPRDVSNLTVQPVWESYRKDRIEAKLQCLVCTGQVALDVAQRAVSDDWLAAYHAYARLKCRRPGRTGTLTAVAP